MPQLISQNNLRISVFYLLYLYGMSIFSSYLYTRQARRVLYNAGKWDTLTFLRPDEFLSIHDAIQCSYFLSFLFCLDVKTKISILVDVRYKAMATNILLLKWNQIMIYERRSRVGFFQSLKRDVIRVSKLSLISSSLFFVST